MTDVRVGDEVEVTYRYKGTVEKLADVLGREQVDGKYFYLTDQHGRHFVGAADDAAVVVTKKAPPKVGDKLTTVAELRALKRHSVIQHGHFHALSMEDGKFVDEMGLKHNPRAFSSDGITLTRETTLVALPPEG